MKEIILTIVLVASCFFLFSQSIKIKISDYSTKQYYKDITYLTEGGSSLVNPLSDTSSEIAYRVIITTSEIYDDLIIEKVSYGSEGGNKQILSKRKVDIESLWSAFNLLGEIAGITFSKWVSWDSFELNIQGSFYLVNEITPDSITVSKK